MVKLLRYAPYACLAAAVALVFGQAVRFEFVQWDDPLHITQNPFYSPLTLASFGRLMITAYFGLYIPAAYAFWAALSLVSQWISPADGVRFDPRVYHAANLLLHASCGWLVYQVTMRLVRSREAACLGALVFLLHPLQVESVCWVSEARGLLAAAGSLGALALILAPGESPPAANERRGYGRLAATLCFLLALMCKPSAVTLPLVVVVVLHLTRGTSWRGLWNEYWDWFLLSAVWVLITRFAQPTAETLAPVAVWQRPLVMGDALAFYLGKLVYPVDLVMDYGRTPAVALAQRWTAAWALVPVAVLGGAWWLLRGRAARAGIALFLLAPLPVLGLLPFQYQRISTVADRYLYFSLVGVAFIVAELVVRFGRVGTVTAAIVAALLGWQSWQTAPTWHDSIALFERTLAVNPRSVPALNNLGVLAQQRGDQTTAGQYYRRALAISPQEAEANTGLGTVLLAEGKLDEALAHFQVTLRQMPQLDRPNAGVANIYHRQGNTRRAVEFYRRALSPDPRVAAATLTPVETATAANQFARILATDHDAGLRDGRLAVQWASRAVALTQSQSSASLDTLAAALAEAGDFPRAVQAAERAAVRAAQTGRPERTARYKAHLEMFRAGMPLRETAAEQLAR
ncbi:MAG: tetratricopeptide repeat protein [Pirellulales bacterium]|nr:tetratricopeptide repeat protein [Pirellulales bacterium]